MKPIVVTGATGTVGSAVLDQLLAAGAPVRAAVRSPEKLAGRPGIEAVSLDFSRPETLEAALAGADHVFLLTALTPEMTDQSNALVDAAKNVGIEHVVKISALGAGPAATIRLGQLHTEGERYLEASGLGWTHLRPNSFMQNYLAFHGEAIRTQSAFYLPHGNGQMSLIDARDVAAVAVEALTRPGHMGQAYELTGGTAIDNRDVAATLSRVLGREITYVDVPDAAAEKAMRELGTPDILVDALMGLNGIIKAGHTAVVHSTVESVTGRAPRTFDQFAQEHAAEWS
jgi:uncharacterized protein YbjT (DUF2867 family)